MSKPLSSISDFQKEVKMKNKNQTILALGLILFVALGCNLASQIKKQAEKSDAPKVINATDNTCQLTVPGSWQIRTDLHEEATLQAANLLAEQYAVVISESKSNFTEDILIRDYTDLLIRSTTMKVPDATFSEIKSATINGYEANQFEADGSVDKIKIKWLFTVINAPRHFHQIVTWSTPTRYEKNKDVFLGVINSFKETETGNSPVLPANTKPKGKK